MIESPQHIIVARYLNYTAEGNNSEGGNTLYNGFMILFLLTGDSWSISHPRDASDELLPKEKNMNKQHTLLKKGTGAIYCHSSGLSYKPWQLTVRSKQLRW